MGHICNEKYITHAWVQGRTCSLSSGSLRKPEQNFAGYWSDFIWHHLLLQSNRSHRWVYIDDRCVQCNCNFCGHSSSTVVLYFYRSLFDGVELCRHCPGVVDQALVHDTFLYPTNHFIYPTNLVHGVDDKEEAPTKSHLEWSTTNHLLSVNKIFHYLNSSRVWSDAASSKIRTNLGDKALLFSGEEGKEGGNGRNDKAASNLVIIVILILNIVILIKWICKRKQRPSDLNFNENSCHLDLKPSIRRNSLGVDCISRARPRRLHPLPENILSLYSSLEETVAPPCPWRIGEQRPSSAGPPCARQAETQARQSRRQPVDKNFYLSLKYVRALFSEINRLQFTMQMVTIRWWSNLKDCQRRLQVALALQHEGDGQEAHVAQGLIMIIMLHRTCSETFQMRHQDTKVKHESNMRLISKMQSRALYRQISKGDVVVTLSE